MKLWLFMFWIVLKLFSNVANWSGLKSTKIDIWKIMSACYCKLIDYGVDLKQTLF